MTSPEDLAVIEKGARENGHLIAPCYLRIALIHMQQLAAKLEELDGELKHYKIDHAINLERHFRSD